jgi:hypothetical protein
MKGHNYYGICKRCGKIHVPPNIGRKFWIDKPNPRKGKKLSEETKSKISKSNKGKRRSEETKKRISIGQTGRKLSDETKNKLSVAHKGKKHTEEHKQKIKNSCIETFKEEKYRKKRRETMFRLWKEGTFNGMFTLDKNPRWRGGVSYEPYGLEFNKKLKELIKERDNYCCLLCGITQIESIYILDTELSVHHIDFNKYNNEPKNLLTICEICHNKITKWYYDNKRRKKH